MYVKFVLNITYNFISFQANVIIESKKKDNILKSTFQ